MSLNVISFMMSYSDEFCTFENLRIENGQDAAASSSSMISGEGSSEVVKEAASSSSKTRSLACGSEVMTLLDMYAGCGGMSTGQCMGAAASYVSLVTIWAVKMPVRVFSSITLKHR